MDSFHHVAETYLVPMQLAFAMLGMGATLAVADFVTVFKNPRGLLLGLALQLLYVPLLALLFVAALSLEPGWAVGLILVAATPGGTTSNLFTYFAKGSVPLSIAVTTVSTLASLVTIPTLLTLLASSRLPADFAFPTREIIEGILLYLMLPLAVGMVCHRAFEKAAPHIATWAIRASVLMILLVTISALSSGRIDIAEYGVWPPFVIVLFAVTLVISVPHVCRLFGRYDDETVALTIEVVVRNVGIALLLVFYFFRGEDEQGHVLYTCLFYSGITLPCILPLIIAHRRGATAVFLRERRRRD